MNVYDIGARPDNPLALAANTVAFQKALDSGKHVFVPSGEWHVGALVGTNGVRFEAESPSAVLVYAGVVPLLDFAGKVDWEVSGFTARGTGTVSYATFYPTIPDVGQDFIKISWADRFQVSGLRLSDFAGRGIVYQNSGGWEGRKGSARDCHITRTFKAVHTHSGGEYVHFGNVIADRCTFGFHVDSGNVIFDGCMANYCGVGAKATAGTNHGHGVFSGCLLNHNNYNLDVYDAVTQGESFIGCQFNGGIDGCGDGKVRIYNSTGVNITGGQMVSKLIVDGGGCNLIAHNFMRDCPAPSIVNGAVVRIKENYDASGAWAYNN